MNKDELLSNFSQLKTKLQEKWNKLTDEDIAQIKGSYEQLLNKLQQKYSLNRLKAEEELKNFSCESCNKSNDKSKTEKREKIKSR